MKQLLVVIGCFSSVALADRPPNVKVEQAADHRGEQVHLEGDITVKPSTFFGCAFTSSKQWIAFELGDGSHHVIAYCKATDGHCRGLDKTERKQALPLLAPLVKIAASKAHCDEVQVELQNW